MRSKQQRQRCPWLPLRPFSGGGTAMGYLYLLGVAIMFSFGGTCNKLISPFFDTTYITMFRFIFGVFFLLLLKVLKRQRFRSDFKTMLRVCLGWILFGAVSKWGAYLAENYALAHGTSYGNIITMPIQTVFITAAGAFFFREKISLKKGFCIFLCIAGVLCISWNGRSLRDYLQTNVLLTALFCATGCLAGMHVIAQKMIADKMDIIDSNLSIFAVSSVISIVQVAPNTLSGSLKDIHPNVPCLIAILAFGFITGIGFYLNAKAIPLVPIYMVPVVQSGMVIFSVIWGVLFFKESVSAYVIAGIALFMVGLFYLNVLNKKDEAEAKAVCE